MRGFDCGCREMLLIGLALLGLVSGGNVRAEATASNAKLNKPIEHVTLLGADAKPFALDDLKGKRAVVVVFLSFDCPVSTSYSPLLTELAATYDKQGVAFVGVSGTDEDAAAVAGHGRVYALSFPVLADPKHIAADAFKAEITPEAFLLDHNLVLRYRGRIDNSYAARLKKNNQTTRHDLKEALEELLAGKDVREPITTAIGCPITRPTTATATGPVTYNRDVLPILQNHCQGCHRPGEVGPFSLMTYKQAVNWAADIKDYTREHKMPPWKPVAGASFHNQRRLSDREIATLAAWADGGTPEGDPKDAPPPRQFTDGWQLGQPDLVLTVEDDFVLGPSGRDAFRCFVLPTNLTEDKYVTAVELRPGNRRVVHHSLLFLDSTGKGRELVEKEKKREARLNEQDHGPGYSVAMGVGFTPQGGIGGWAPGQLARNLPAGTGYLLPKGADVIMQLHYHRNGRVEKDRTSIGLYFARSTEGMQRFRGMVIRGDFFYIPSGKADYRVTGGIEVTQDCQLHSVMPHMHMLGRKVKVTMQPPGGEATTLVAIDDWDYNWQETYFLKEPLSVKAGTKLRVEALYDNSADNPNNPFSPPRWVFFGEQTTNEMCFVFFGATSDKPGRLAVPEGTKPR